MAAIIEKVTNACCGGLDTEGDKLTSLFGKKKAEKEDEDEVAAPEAAPESKPDPAPEAKTDPTPEEKTEATPESKPRGTMKENKAPVGKFTGKDTKYEDVEWDDLPEDVREAALTLGYEKETWENNGWPAVQDKAFGALDEAEAKAADTLGWDVTSWDTKYEDKDFAELPEKVKEAAESVGFTQEMWDDDEWPAIGDKAWDDMTKDEQCALNVFGYTKVDWDNS